MPTDAPSITVVIPAYNRASTLARALASVARQTLAAAEVIVVDDGSSDGTAAVAGACEHPGLRIIRHDSNRGAAAARNTGLRAARGDYIALLDSDDEWTPDKLAMQLAELCAATPDILASCTAYSIREGAFTRDHFPHPVGHDDLFMGCDLSPGATLMMARPLVDEIGLFDETLPRYEDWDWLLRYTERYRIGIVQKPLAVVYYSPHGGARTMERSATRLLAKYDDQLRALGRAGRRARGLRWMEVARYYAIERNPGGFIICAARALRAYPLYRPGTLLLLADAWFGTRLAARIETLRAHRGLRDR
jgi:glycosyltransferase involved in cell wall biosynthesis